MSKLLFFLLLAFTLPLTNASQSAADILCSIVKQGGSVTGKPSILHGNTEAADHNKKKWKSHPLRQGSINALYGGKWSILDGATYINANAETLDFLRTQGAQHAAPRPQTPQEVLAFFNAFKLGPWGSACPKEWFIILSKELVAINYDRCSGLTCPMHWIWERKADGWYPLEEVDGFIDTKGNILHGEDWLKWLRKQTKTKK